MDFLALANGSHPRRMALIKRRETWTYAELHQRVETLSMRLHAAGLRPAQRLGVHLDNQPDYVTLIHAAARLGLTLVPLNVRLSVEEIAFQVEKAGCQTLIYETRYQDKIAELTVQVPNLRTWTLANLPSATKSPPSLGDNPLQSIIFTSGTSGRPKGARLTFENQLWSALSSALRLGVLPDDRWLLTLPLYHVGGMAIVFRSALYGSALVLPDFPSGRFDVEALWRSLHAQHVTLVSLVPTMLHRLLEAYGDQPWPASLRTILLGGASAPPELLARASQRGLPVAVTYGLTEAASQVATAAPHDARLKPGSVGRPLMWTQIRVVDDQGTPLPPGETGEIQVKGPTVMAGYDGEPEATRRVLQDGWLATGDLGYLDADGDLWVVQRRSDLIISGGENVYPSEVEAVLRQHPDVAQACVVGLADAEWGQRVAAAIVPRPGTMPASQDLIQFCRQHLGGYKVPKIIRIVHALPQTAAGKILRRAVPRLFEPKENQRAKNQRVAHGSPD